MEAEELGRRLRMAREARGLSQQAVAGALGLARTAITQMEAGNRSVSTLELAKLAERYLRPVSSFFQEGPRDEDEDVLVALYRVAPGLEGDPAMQEQVARCVSLCREGVGLERFLGTKPRSGPPNYPVRVPRSSWEAVAQGEQTAVEERQRLGIGYAPIADVSELIASQGIWASGVGLPNEMSGVFLRHPRIGFAILVNSSHPRGRKRFSYAHEYAHALLDRDRNIAISSTGNSSEMVERRANAFAAAFLMPRNGVYEALRRLDKGLPSRQEQTIFDVASGGRIDAEFRSPARFATSQLQGHRDARSPIRSELSGRVVPVEEPPPRLPRGVPGTPGTGNVRSAAPPGAQHGWRYGGTRTTGTVNCEARLLTSPSRHIVARRSPAAAFSSSAICWA